MDAIHHRGNDGTRATPLGYALVLTGAYAPALVALALTGWTGGATGAGTLLRRILIVDVPVRYYLFAIFYMAAVKLIGASGRGNVSRLRMAVRAHPGQSASRDVSALCNQQLDRRRPIRRRGAARGVQRPRIRDVMDYVGCVVALRIRPVAIFLAE